MELGAFSISLAVKDIEASRRFYEHFGFKVFAGDASQNWLILKNGDHAIGLFQGMFEKNILTFSVLSASLHELTRFFLILSVHQPTRARRTDGRGHTGAFQIDQSGRDASPDRAVA